MTQKPFRIVQLSDLHIFADPDHALLGVKTRDSFSALFDYLVSDKKRPDILLLSGDLSQDSSEASYRFVGDKIQPLGIPTYYIPGNHDDAKVMDKIYPYGVLKADKQIVLDSWQLILLDSHIHGKVHGNLDAQQLQFLEACLARYPTHRAIIVFHHQPVPVGCVWLDKLGLHNADELWSLLKNYPQVHTVLFGHVHQQYEGKKNNIAYYSVPSTCIQFKKNVVEFALDDIPPSYRWIDLYATGELITGVEQLDHYVGDFDKNAKGY